MNKILFALEYYNNFEAKTIDLIGKKTIVEIYTIKQ